MTDDSDALSNWEVKDDPYLDILMVIFSLLIAVYPYELVDWIT